MRLWEIIQGIWKRNKLLIMLLLASLILRIAWVVYTGYVAEDAFITFRFAQNLAEGRGFTYNPGQRVYGTTTPMFTFLMALWNLLCKDPVPGAWLFNLLAGLGTLYFTYRGLEAARVSPAQRLFALLLLILSPRLLHLDMLGMETPLVLLFMAASWSTFQRKRWYWTGILLGLMLWVRIDTALWLMIIGFVTFQKDRRAGWIVVGLASATYFPWLLFAFFSFGTPIPMTIIAKYWAYTIRGHAYNVDFIEPAFSMLLVRLKPIGDVLKGSTLYNLSTRIDAVNTFATVLSITLTTAGAILALRKRKLYPIIGFLILEIIRLTVFRITFFNRYFVAAIWSTCILSGYCLGHLWDVRYKSHISRMLSYLLPAVVLLLSVSEAFRGANYYRDFQHYRHDGSLKPIGKWLFLNMEEGATIQLEPLGYIGYYSELIMLDEVGLVTPIVIQMKQQNITQPVQMVVILRPDAFVIHCDDAQRISDDHYWIEVGGEVDYEFMTRFDPLNYLGTARVSESDKALARASCYEVWVKSELKR